MPPDVGRIIMSKLQWQASKLHRGRFGEKIDVDHSGRVVFNAAPLDDQL